MRVQTDDDSSDEEDAKISAPKAKPSPAPKPVNLVRVPSGRDSSKTLSSADEDSDDSSSDDSSSSSEDATVLKKKKNVVASKKAATSSSSSSSSDDSSSNESKPAPKPASMPKKKPAVAAKEESSSEDSSSEDSSSEDSSSDEEDELETAVVKKAAASSSSSSPSEDSSDEDELEEDTSKPASKPTPSVDKAKASTSLDLEETKAVKKRRTGENGSSVVTATATPEPLRATESQGSAFQSKGGKGKPPRKSNTPFQRVKAEQTQIDHDELKDNSFESRRAGAGDYGERASRDLIVTRGDGFRKEKNKKKRGSYKGGEITVS
ncbi:hypothetical protein FA95DRAFT_1568234 [Auriscalpium vulgare]|uniref:Uncharacterized protein n=1 Tax=Auriscalpium vulgare TaxID=40419 RepID=A0ACB8SCD9_9AGAM|nr:hypothetical protein FA95DRAFT_1568234 [Auriscalpium vulgare]